MRDAMHMLQGSPHAPQHLRIFVLLKLIEYRVWLMLTCSSPSSMRASPPYSSMSRRRRALLSMLRRVSSSGLKSAPCAQRSAPFTYIPSDLLFIQSTHILSMRNTLQASHCSPATTCRRFRTEYLHWLLRGFLQ